MLELTTLHVLAWEHHEPLPVRRIPQKVDGKSGDGEKVKAFPGGRCSDWRFMEVGPTVQNSRPEGLKCPAPVPLGGPPRPYILHLETIRTLNL